MQLLLFQINFSRFIIGEYFLETVLKYGCLASIKKMTVQTLLPDKTVSLFVKNIWVFDEAESNKPTVLPFFADGYPGLMFQQTIDGLYVQPHNKKMPVFFLYGQTIKPIELLINGNYKLIVFQLYPFVLKNFFGVDPKQLNDNCYNLEQVQTLNAIKVIEQLQANEKAESRVKVITSFLHNCFQTKKENLDFKVRQSLQLIIENKGQLAIAEICRQLKLNARTFERRFSSVIIQFQQSLEQLSANNFTKLSDIVYENGFADQSHFIRVFKAFTGKTPGKFESLNT
jgi:AraC-like DNA-binding protein